MLTPLRPGQQWLLRHQLLYCEVISVVPLKRWFDVKGSHHWIHNGKKTGVTLLSWYRVSLDGTYWEYYYAGEAPNMRRNTDLITLLWDPAGELASRAGAPDDLHQPDQPLNHHA